MQYFMVFIQKLKALEQRNEKNLIKIKIKRIMLEQFGKNFNERKLRSEKCSIERN